MDGELPSTQATWARESLLLHYCTSVRPAEEMPLGGVIELCELHGGISSEAAPQHFSNPRSFIHFIKQ